MPAAAAEVKRATLGQRASKVKGPSERITTVRLINATTEEMWCTRLSKVQRTLALINHGSCLCEAFLAGKCPDGNRCRLVHVPQHHMWRRVEPTEVEHGGVRLYGPGFELCCYAPDMGTYYRIPSSLIVITAASESYVDVHNECGANFKEKFFLCPAMSGGGECANAEHCAGIHCAARDLDQFEPVQTHMAFLDRVAAYPRLPDDVVVRAQPPNGGDAESFPGGRVLRTAGADKYEAAFRSAGGEPELTMQHCAHFRSHDMCREGANCGFLHVVTDALKPHSPPPFTTAPAAPPAAAAAAPCKSPDYVQRHTLRSRLSPVAVVTADGAPNVTILTRGRLSPRRDSPLSQPSGSG